MFLARQMKKPIRLKTNRLKIVLSRSFLLEEIGKGIRMAEQISSIALLQKPMEQFF